MNSRRLWLLLALALPALACSESTPSLDGGSTVEAGADLTPTTDAQPRLPYPALDMGLAPSTGLPYQRYDVLVMVNDNSRASREVGEYYAQRRNVPVENIAHVRVRASTFISLDEFRSLRDQLIKFMQENTLDDPSITPVVCQDGEPPYYCEASMKQLREHSTIRYVITTMGVPSRFLFSGSTLPYGGSTSVDNYLRHYLVDYFPSDVTFRPLDRPRAFGDGRGMRIVEPKKDGERIIGRIDGLTIEAAKRLVDRAIAAEQNGVYGKLYGSRYSPTFALARWWDYAASEHVYGDDESAYRYQHGIFGQLEHDGAVTGVRHTDDPACASHLESSHTVPEGKSPQGCVVKLSYGNEAPPANLSSRQPWVDDALVYLGSLDGQPTTGSFARFTYWRRDASCDTPLCKDATDPAACQVASTDVFKEINTACMGVAEGFIGYNLQSFPVSYLGVWPTGWITAGGDWQLYPEVRDDDGQDDDFSVAYRNSDMVDTPRCYADAAALASQTLSDCPADLRRVALAQLLTFPAKSIVADHSYTLKFWYKAEGNEAASNLRVRLRVHDATAGNDEVEHGSVVLQGAIPIGGTVTVAGNVDGWVQASATIPLDIAKHDCAAPCSAGVSYDRLRIIVETAQLMSGSLFLDNFALEESVAGAITPVALVNPSFKEGHEQVNHGDHAANFLSRLNGVAFWGSLSHHQSGGHSFEKHPLETLIYFARGLPLGDAVWFAEQFNSGMLYGDPLYSPLAVRFDYLNAADFVGAHVSLSGIARNGLDETHVETRYAIDYCPGVDFYLCDQAGSWVSTGLSGPSTRRPMRFGQWETQGLTPGDYTLRLAVTSTNASSARAQTFYDYYPVTLYSDTSDTDGDGLSDKDEVEIYGSDPTQLDSDGDGLEDFAEVTEHGTSPARADTDGDGMRDDWELKYPGLDPTRDDGADDLDGDGLDNAGEHAAGSDPTLKDTDGDGLEDGPEVLQHGTDPTLEDTDKDRVTDAIEIARGSDPLTRADDDGDGLWDDWERWRGTDPLRADGIDDPDGDGVANAVEFLRDTDPRDASSKPSVGTLFVDASATGSAEDGSAQNPFLTVVAAIAAAEHGDTLSIAPGRYLTSFALIPKALALRAPQGGVTFAPTYLMLGSPWGELDNVIVESSYQLRFSAARAFRVSRSRFEVAQGVVIAAGSHVTFENTVFVGQSTTTCVQVSASRATISHTTLAGCAVGISLGSDGVATIENSILQNAADLEGFADATGLRFNLIAQGDFAWVNGNLPGLASFVDAPGGDYHQRADSAGIDTGDPAANFSDEPAGGGGRVNMGAYGNTSAATAADDSDGDGMPDGFEVLAGLNVGVDDADADSDGDNFSNVEEYRASTDPRNPTSVP